MYLFDQQDSDLRITGAYKTHPQAKTMYVRLKDNRYMHRAIMICYFGNNAKLNFGVANV